MISDEQVKVPCEDAGFAGFMWMKRCVNIFRCPSRTLLHGEDLSYDYAVNAYRLMLRSNPVILMAEICRR